MAVTTSGRVALYLQDKHPIRDGMEYVKLAEAARLRGRVAGGEPARARGDRADGRVRRGHRRGSPSAPGVVNNWTRNVGLLAATFSTLDDLAPGPGEARHRRVVGSARGKVGIHRHKPLTRCARRSRRSAGCSPWSA